MTAVYQKFSKILDVTTERMFSKTAVHKLKKKFLNFRYKIQNPDVGKVNFGDLRRLTPIDKSFGLRRGTAIDRYYIEKFLSSNSSDIKGRVLEIGDSRYTKKFGNNKVTKSDVLHVVEGAPEATIIGDLTVADNIPSDMFDCIICTQTIQMIYDIHAAIGNLYRILKPNGVLLVTTHGTSKIGRQEGVDDWGEYWRLTTQSAKKLFAEDFDPKNVKIQSYGNVFSAITFLHGLSKEELTQNELDYVDPHYEVIIGIRAKK